MNLTNPSATKGQNAAFSQASPLMDTSSNSPPSSTPGRHFSPSPPFADRIFRALCHRLLLLHRSDATFHVLGATGNVYTVALSLLPTCTCPDRAVPCKHILFVLLRVLGLPLDDPCLRRRTLRPFQLSRLLALPTSPETLAGRRTRERFHQLCNQPGREVLSPAGNHVKVGGACPVCLEEMLEGERVVGCRVCRNSLHEECFARWKSSAGRRRATCVLCRARWREPREQDRYVNLAAYVSEEDDEGGEEEGASCTAHINSN